MRGEIRMDIRTGQVFTNEQIEVFKKYLEGERDQETIKDFKKTTKGMLEKDKPKNISDLKPIDIPLTGRQKRKLRIGRNDPCPCGSGVKFKKCCRQKGR
jgi:uncharacterized protein YecA (UPF0149 family)